MYFDKLNKTKWVNQLFKTTYIYIIFEMFGKDKFFTYVCTKVYIYLATFYKTLHESL